MSSAPSDEGLVNAPLVINPILRHFMVAQFGNLFKFSLWWASLAPLFYSMTNGATSIIGVSRIAYNAAICIFNPPGAVLPERYHPRKILLTAAFIRMLIYVLLVPATWLLFCTNVAHVENVTVVYTLLAIFSFIDGVAVAGSCVLDIDMAGLDIVSGTYGIEVTDAHRNYFNSAQELFFSLCFIFFAPAMAFLGLGVKAGFHQWILRGDMTDDQAESGVLVLVFMIGFGLASVVQFVFLLRMPLANAEASTPAGADTDSSAVNSEAPLATVGGHDSEQLDESAMVSKSLCGGVLSDLKASVLVVVSHQPILFRLLFLGFEIAFEDAAIVVIAAQMGLRCQWLGDGHSIQGNIWTAVAVAAGKLGGAIASVAVMKFYQPPEEPMGYLVLFVMTTLSTLVTCGFPLIEQAFQRGHLNADGARGIHLTLFFLYFFLSTLPKLGFMSLLQSLVSKVENGTRAFGFIAIIATAMDAIVVMGLSSIFIDSTISLENALWYTSFCYMAHGVLELFCGPFLVLRPLQVLDAADKLSNTLAEPLNKPGVDPADNGGGDGIGAARTQFTQRSAAVPVDSHSEHDQLLSAGEGRGGATGGGVKTAVLGMTQATPIAVIVRRNSTMDDGLGGGGGLGSVPVGSQGGARVGSYMRHGAPRTPRSARENK